MSPRKAALLVGLVGVVGLGVDFGTRFDMAELQRWWRRAPNVTLDEIDATPTPQRPDPNATVLKERPADDIASLEVWVSTSDVRDVVVREGQLLAATTGGLLAVDLRATSLEDGCLTVPFDAITRLGTADGLPSHRIDDILLDGDRAWLATSRGVVEVDLRGPVPVVRRVLSAGLHSPRVSTLAHRGGVLYAGTHDGGLHRLEDTRFVPVSLGDRRLRVINRLLTDEGGLSIATPQGIVRLDEDGARRIGRRWITDLARLEDGTVLATGPEGTYRVTPKRLVAEPGEPGRRAAARLVQHDRLLVVGLDGEVWERGGRRVSLGLGGSVRALATRDGVEWWATSQGLVLRDPAGHLHPIRVGGLPANDLTAVAVVGDRVVVGGFESGIAVREDGGFRPLTLGLSPQVNHLTPAGGDAVWVSTNDGLYRVDLEREVARRFGTDEGLASDHVMAVSVDDAARVYVATGAGLTIMTPDPLRPSGYSVRTLRAQHGLPSENLYSVAASTQGVFAGTLHGLVRLSRNGEIHTTTPGDGRLPDGWVTAVLPTGDDELWIGTYDAGLVRVRGSRWERMAVGIGLVSGRVNPSALARHGDRVLVGTAGGGLLVLRGEEVRRYRTTEGLPSDDVTAVASDHDALWVATRGGLARLELRPVQLAMEVGPR